MGLNHGLATLRLTVSNVLFIFFILFFVLDVNDVNVDGLLFYYVFAYQVSTFLHEVIEF